jgi:hypothetical protein
VDKEEKVSLLMFGKKPKRASRRRDDTRLVRGAFEMYQREGIGEIFIGGSGG